MTKRWSSVKSGSRETKRAASKKARRAADIDVTPPFSCPHCGEGFDRHDNAAHHSYFCAQKRGTVH